jgi:transcriptional regulator with XRE-family HTH domain
MRPEAEPVEATAGRAAQPRRLSAALRELRQTSGLTLTEISKRTGVSISALSKVQSGQMSLTYDKLVGLAAGLGVDVTYFFAPEPAATAEPGPPTVTGRRSIERFGGGALISTPVYEYRYLSSDLSRKQMTPMYATPKARSIEEFGDLIRHSGEEFASVVEGRIELHTEFYAPVVLEAGDTVYFDAAMGHAYVAAIDGPCLVMCVCSGMDTDIAKLAAPSSQGRVRPPAPRVERASKRRS